MMLGLKSGLQIAAKTGMPAGLLFRQIWYSVWKAGVLGITEYCQGRPLISLVFPRVCDVSTATTRYGGEANTSDTELTDTVDGDRA